MATLPTARQPLERQVLTLQRITVAWMLVECSAALVAAAQAHSVSLLAFGSDSVVELLSALVVLLQFSPASRLSPVRAARLCGGLLYVLAGIVSLIAVAGLSLHLPTETSRLGIVVTAGALLLMPVLARRKRKAAHQLNSHALRADSVQSATCAYLAAITLTGLVLRLLLGFRWLDPLAALAAVPILLIEARRARRGHVCAHC